MNPLLRRLPGAVPTLLLALFTTVCAEPTLHLDRGNHPEAIAISGSGDASSSQQLGLSNDLHNWWPVHAVRDRAHWNTEWRTRDQRDAFFRLVERSPPLIARHPSWKNRLELPHDDFSTLIVEGSGSNFQSRTFVNWVKFALVIDDLPQVYFQNGADYPFHFDFASERLAPFHGMSLAQFNSVSLRREGQQVVLGAVLWEHNRNEYGIQFVGQDPYPREMVRFLYETVDAKLIQPEGLDAMRGFYLPTFEQAAVAERDRDYFAHHGIEVASAQRWFLQNVSYSDGWALGRLLFVPAEEIADSYRAGTLKPTDILLTDGVPAEVPFVAGIVTLSPATPNSHVAILAQSYGIPFVYIRIAEQQDKIRELVGREVVLRTRVDTLFTSPTYDQLGVGVYPVIGLEPSYRQEILALKQPPPLLIPPISSFGKISMQDLSDVGASDIRFVGGKAANFGFLRREIPNHSPNARAFTFDLWRAYLDQVLPGGIPLRTAIESRLHGLTWPTDIRALDASLKEIRKLIKEEAHFSPAQRRAILTTLEGMDPTRRIRFRSSTNVEDSGVFVGAGLYDSFSGCIADDTDADTVGPSHCDPTQAKERGVFRAMRKVYASFYNLNAFIERLRHGVDEREVGMAILAHYSFPDETEAANGVATSFYSGEGWISTTMVSQVGAESVTNPSGETLPEIVNLYHVQGQAPSSRPPRATQRSSLLLLGDALVMEGEDYRALGELFRPIWIAYERAFPQNAPFTLEFEFKKLTDGRLVVKQVREVPQTPGQEASAAALLNTDVPFRVFQGYDGSLFGNHRLKSLWQLHEKNRWIDPLAPSSSLMDAVELEYPSGGRLLTRTGSLNSWPGAAFEVEPGVASPHGEPAHITKDRWTDFSEGGPTTYELQIRVPAHQHYRHDPIYSLEDWRIEWHATYQSPLVDFDLSDFGPSFDGITSTTSEFAILVKGTPNDPLPVGAKPSRHHSTSPGGVAIETAYHLDTVGTGPLETASLRRWVGTTISGLTTLPIRLQGYYSQTYRAGRHNEREWFLYEPGLEEDIDSGVLTQLKASNIRMIFFYRDYDDPERDLIKAIGFDGSVRPL